MFYSRSGRKVIFDIVWVTKVSSRKSLTLDLTLDMTGKYMFFKKSNAFFLFTGLT